MVEGGWECGERLKFGGRRNKVEGGEYAGRREYGGRCRMRRMHGGEYDRRQGMRWNTEGGGNTTEGRNTTGGRIPWETGMRGRPECAGGRNTGEEGIGRKAESTGLKAAEYRSEGRE